MYEVLMKVENRSIKHKFKVSSLVKIKELNEQKLQLFQYLSKIRSSKYSKLT